MTEPRYPRLAVDVREDEADAAADLLFELGSTGVEWRDSTTLARADGGKVCLLASFERDDDAHAAADALPPNWSPRRDDVVGDAWRDAWRQTFEPFTIAGNVVIAPPWKQHVPQRGERVIVLEPGRAFGTGLHETTRLVAEGLVDRAPRFAGSAVLDVGCGSGVLALVALALGAKSARAVDTDPEAVLATRENAARNGVSDQLLADGTTLALLLEGGARYPMVVANIEAATLVELAPALQTLLAPSGTLILGGVLAPEVAPDQLLSMRRAFGALREEELRRKGEWIAVVWTRQ